MYRRESMGLTEDEKEFDCPVCRTRFRPIPKLDPRECVEGRIVDRLVAENEELQSRLDTIKKALEEIELQTSYVGGKEMPIVIIKAHNIARAALDEGKVG